MKYLIVLVVLIALVAIYLKRRGSSGVHGEDKSIPRSLGQTHRSDGPTGGGGGF